MGVTLYIATATAGMKKQGLFRKTSLQEKWVSSSYLTSFMKNNLKFPHFPPLKFHPDKLDLSSFVFFH